MEYEIVTQPFDHEGNKQTLGSILIDLISNKDIAYSEIWIVSAFVNNRAFLRLMPYLEDYARRASIHIVFGIDHLGTSIEAMSSIYKLNVDTKVFFNPTRRNTFHPKIYLFEARDQRVDLFIGSNNLTNGGLYTNYEACVRLTFNLPADQEQYLHIKTSLTRFISPSGDTVQPLSKELINLLEGKNLALSERRPRRQMEPEQTDEKTEAEEIPFSREVIPFAPMIDVSIEPDQAIQEAPSDRREKNGILVWRKENLPASDVQRQRGNVTGGLRLTQARWEVENQRIDHTSYFRNDVFGNLYWTKGIYKPLGREVTLVPFEINILDKYYGIHELIVSHKPSGEAGQRNYTTMLHWGNFGNTIKALNLVGRNFELYRLPDDREAFFLIRIY